MSTRGRHLVPVLLMVLLGCALTFEIRVAATDVEAWSRGLSERCG